MKKIFALITILFLITPLVLAERDSFLGTDNQRTANRNPVSSQLDAGKDIRDKLQEARMMHTEKRVLVMENKERLKNCNASETEECQRYRENAKEFVLNLADRIINHLNLIKTRIQESDLSDEEVSEIISDIDLKISQVEEIKAKVESSETNEELREASKELKSLLKNIKNRIRIHELRSLHLGIGKIIQRSEKISEDVQCTITNMEENGLDAAEITSLSADYNSKVESAKSSYDAAFEKFKEAKESETPVEIVKEGKLLIRETISYLKEARTIFHDITEKIKEQNAEFVKCEIGAENE